MAKSEALQSAPGAVRKDARHLWRELRRRTVEPLRDMVFIAYLIAGIVVFSAWGIWLELIKYYTSSPGTSSNSLFTSLVTFFPALIGSCSIQLMFDSGGKALKAMSIVWIIFFVVLAAWLTMSHDLAKPIAFLIATLASLVAVWTWCVANADVDAFRDELDVAAPVGGPINQPLSGDLTGFRH